MRISVLILLTVGIFTVIALLPEKSFGQSDNCGSAPTISSAPSPGSCISGTLPLAATYTAIPGGTGCSGSTNDDVWYTFFANSTNPTIKYTAGTLTNGRIQLFSGSCTSMTSLFCSTGTMSASGLTIGNQYWIRIYSTSNLNSGTFTICITDPVPSNNTCASASLLTSSTTCVNTTGNVYAATNSGPSITADCAGSVVYDVWYKFVAQTTNPTITLSNIGSAFTNPAIELLSGSCASLTALYCGTTSIVAGYNELTPGTTYYIRVYSSSGTPPTSPTNANFDICIVDPVSPAPFNDDCANAINLQIGNSCNNANGSIAGATLSSGVALSGACTGTVAYDVWYKFTAVNATATITLSSLGANFTSPGIQIFSGACGSLTAIACNNGTSLSAAGLTAGNTYYVRVFSTAVGSAPNGNGRFNICATTTNAPVRFGNSYVNVSKKTTGGVVEPGDILEIRFTVNHTSGTMTQLRYVDNVPTKTQMLTAQPIQIITNEGLNYKSYTTAAGDDAATYKAVPALNEYQIRLNLGFASGAAPGVPTVMTNAATSANGQMSASTDRPRGGGGMLFAIAYRVTVTGVVGDTITLFPGQFIYHDNTLGTDVTLTATPFKILISNPLTLCTNSIGLNNAVENGGTFGSGSSLVRSYDLTTPIASYTFVPDVAPFNVIGDGKYSIVKNNSPTSSSFAAAGRKNTCPGVSPTDPLSCNNRMFNGFWYIAGDHSGTNNSTGNAPPGAYTPSGYMLEINADYTTTEVYRQSINNLCPNTYYEFSAWVKNICPTCGIDSTGAQFTGTVTAPTNGYPGVLPNLTFALNDVDYYNSGEIDTLGWLKKGFVFRTGASQTSATFSIRNNSQGGGGNDWAMDDIAVATCLPTMSYSPTINPFVCANNPITIADTVSSFFKNYTTYKWQRSTNAGSSWTDVTGVTSLPDTNYYITSYTVPAANTTPANNNDLYRVVVATSAANLLDANCNISDGVTITLTVSSTCGPPLGVNIISFNGQIINSKAQLFWTTSQENEPVMFIIERSSDGRRFFTAGEVPGNKIQNTVNRYTFTDASQINEATWYRILMITTSGTKQYSSIIQLKNIATNFEMGNIVNPFVNNLSFAVSASKTSEVNIELSDMSGRKVMTSKKMIYAGSNGITLNTQILPAGVYSLRIIYKDQSIIRRVIKQN